jgi:hypothetical protein
VEEGIDMIVINSLQLSKHVGKYITILDTNTKKYIYGKIDLVAPEHNMIVLKLLNGNHMGEERITYYKRDYEHDIEIYDEHEAIEMVFKFDN